MSTVPAPVAGPMGRCYVRRPCRHGSWALAYGVVTAKRVCRTCGVKYTIVVHHETETAEVSPA